MGAAGSSNATANTRTAQKFFKFKVNYNKLKNLLSNPSRPPTNRNRPNNTNRFKERKKDKKKKIGRLHCLSFKFFILTNLNDGNKKFDYFCIGTCIIVQSIPCLRHN